MRLRTTIALFPQQPDREHDDNNCDALQQHAQAHQTLRAVRRAAFHHVPEAKHEHDGDGEKGDDDEKVLQGGWHQILGRKAGSDASFAQLLPSSNRLAITCAWISAAPSKMLRMRASHRTRDTGYSS